MSAQFFFFFFFQENLPLESFQLIPEQLIWLRVKVTSSHFISDLSKYLLYSFEVQTKHYLERYLQTFDGQYKWPAFCNLVKTPTETHEMESDHRGRS